MRELTLILNTAEKRVQFALCENGALLCGQNWLAQRGGTELLAPALREACSRLGTAPAAIRRIACVAGPGNFTGLRIGLTTASGLARALNAKQAGLNYLQCLAASAPALPGEEVLALTNARKGLAYVARFRADENGIPQPIDNTFLMPIPPLPEGVNLGSPAFVIGSALTSNPDCLRSALPAARLLINQTAPSFDALVALEQRINWDTQTGADIPPLYLRDCDAVENLDAIARSQGRTPEIAHQELERLTHAPLAE